VLLQSGPRAVTARADERSGTAASLHSRRRDAESYEGLARWSLPRTDQSVVRVQTGRRFLVEGRFRYGLDGTIRAHRVIVSAAPGGGAAVAAEAGRVIAAEGGRSRSETAGHA
jgi:hypothetical protein